MLFTMNKLWQKSRLWFLLFLCSSKPMSAHTISRPFRLANPTPFEGAAGSGANHMHAAAGPFSWRTTFWTRFRNDFDGYLRRIIPSRFDRSLCVIEEKIELEEKKWKSVCDLLQWVRRRLSPSTSLIANEAGHSPMGRYCNDKPLNLRWQRHPSYIRRYDSLANSRDRKRTRKNANNKKWSISWNRKSCKCAYTASLFARDLLAVDIDKQAHSTIRLRTQHTARLQYKLFGGEALIAIVLVLREHFKMMNFRNVRILTARRTRQCVTVLFVRDKLTIHQSRQTILTKTLDTSNMTSVTRKHQYWVRNIRARETRNLLDVAFDQSEWYGEIFFALRRVLCALEVEFGKRQFVAVTSATDFSGFAQTRNTLRQQHVVPAFGIFVDGECAAFALSAANTQFTGTHAIALRTMDEEMGLHIFLLCKEEN